MIIYERKINWTNRIKWIREIIIYILLIVLFFLLFYFLLGKQTELIRPIITSILVSSLLVFSHIYTGILKYENYQIVIDKNKKYLIIEQKEIDFYGTDVKLKKLSDFKTKKDIESLINNPEKNIGINVYEISKCDIIKEKNKYDIVRIQGTNNKWQWHETKKTAEFLLVKKEETRKIHIFKDNDNYEELIKGIKE